MGSLRETISGSIMKQKLFSISLFPFFLFMIFLYTGCSSQYVVEDFNSSEDYYSKINNNFKDRSAEISLMNGENIEVKDINIISDSVYWQTELTDSYRSSIPLTSIKKINYTQYNSLHPVKFNGSILLKNDSMIYIDNAYFLKDSISYFWKRENVFSKPIQDINSLSYSNHLKGMKQFGLAGMFAGGVFGYKKGSDASIRNKSPELGLIAGSVFFGLTGMISGIIFGNSEVYILNRNDSKTLSFFKQFSFMAGITSSVLSGSFSDNRYYTTTYKEQYTFGLYYLWEVNPNIKIRPGIIYNIKGGIYNYLNSIPNYDINYYQATSNIYFHTFEMPVLILFEPFPQNLQFLKIIIGPSINIPFKDRLEEYFIGPMDEAKKYANGRVNAKIFFSLQYGFGIKWDNHFSTELLFDTGLSGLGNAEMPDGTRLNLKQNNFLISTNFSL